MVYGIALSRNFPSGLALVATMTSLNGQDTRTDQMKREGRTATPDSPTSPMTDEKQLEQRKSLGYQTTCLVAESRVALSAHSTANTKGYGTLSLTLNSPDILTLLPSLLSRLELE